MKTADGSLASAYFLCNAWDVESDVLMTKGIVKSPTCTVITRVGKFEGVTGGTLSFTATIEFPN